MRDIVVAAENDVVALRDKAAQIFENRVAESKFVVEARALILTVRKICRNYDGFSVKCGENAPFIIKFRFSEKFNFVGSFFCVNRGA